MVLHPWRNVFAVGGIAALIVGCADPNAPNRGMATGATTGAVAGGVIGNILGASGRRTEATAIGAAIGAALGGGAGRAMDVQRQDFERQLGAEQYRNEVQLQQLRRDVLLLTLDNEVQFESGSAVITAPMRRTLAKVADVLRQHPGTQVSVIGHTDNVGGAQSNQRLSEQRAEAVRRELVAKGVRADRLVTVGRGATEPRMSNETAAGRAANRRVELLMTQPV